MLYFIALNENIEADLDTKLNINPDKFSLYFLFYKIELNLSANLLHRVLKIYEISQSHLYTEPYSSLNQPNESKLAEADAADDSNHIRQKLNVEKLAKKYEKYLPLFSYNIVFKEPLIKFHPYSHFLMSQSTQNQCYFEFGANFVNFMITRPLNQEQLFDVVSKLSNPSKKLLYDSYVHNHLTVRDAL